jgi:uncharacterized protein with HEPN domain
VSNQGAKDWKIFFTDMKTCAEKIQRYTAGMNAELFKENALVMDATLRNLEVLGGSDEYSSGDSISISAVFRRVLHQVRP